MGLRHVIRRTNCLIIMIDYFIWDRKLSFSNMDWENAHVETHILCHVTRIDYSMFKVGSIYHGSGLIVSIMSRVNVHGVSTRVLQLELC